MVRGWYFTPLAEGGGKKTLLNKGLWTIHCSPTWLRGCTSTPSLRGCVVSRHANLVVCILYADALFCALLRPFLEEDKCATTNEQNGLVFFFLLSFGIFSSLWIKTVVKPLILRKSSAEQFLKNSEKVWWKCAAKCPKVWKQSETILPFGCCPLVFLCALLRTCVCALLRCFPWASETRYLMYYDNMRKT